MADLSVLGDLLWHRDGVGWVRKLEDVVEHPRGLVDVDAHHL